MSHWHFASGHNCIALEYLTMYNVYANLRKADTIQTSSVNIHRSGFKLKVLGVPAAVSDKGMEELVENQPTTANGRLDTKITGKVETESHDVSLTFAYPMKTDVLAMLRKQDVVDKSEAPKPTTTEEAPKPKAKGKNGKAKDAPEADEVVIDRGGVDAGLNGQHTTADAAK